MKKSIFLLILMLLLSACGDTAEFQAEQQTSDDIAKNIANYLAEFKEIEDCNVQIDGKTAVVSLNLAHKHSDSELIALKKRVAADIKQKNATISRVAVNTAPDTLERIQGDEDDNVPNAEKNKDDEIFVNVIPTI